MYSELKPARLGASGSFDKPFFPWHVEHCAESAFPLAISAENDTELRQRPKHNTTNFFTISCSKTQKNPGKCRGLLNVINYRRMRSCRSHQRSHQKRASSRLSS